MDGPALFFPEPDLDPVFLHLLGQAVEGRFGDEFAELVETLQRLGLGFLDDPDALEVFSQFVSPGFVES